MYLDFQVKARAEDGLIAGYSCPCGCTPRLAYAKGSTDVVDGCCCGNEFAVGPAAGLHLHPSDGFALHTEGFTAPWGEPLEAAWKVGTATNVDEPGHGHGDHHDHAESATESQTPATAVDPVCGMIVDIAAATGKDLHVAYEGVDYYFCGKGCKLEFGDDPSKYLHPGYQPSM